MTKELFWKLYHDAKEQPDAEFYIGEYGYPDYFDDISEDANEVVRKLTEIHQLAHMTMAEVVEHLYNKEYKGRVIIDDKLKAAIDAYYEQYGVK